MTRETLELLRACALQAPADELAERFRAVSLEDLLPAARSHGMLSGLAVALRDVPDVPEQLRGELEGWYHRGLAGHMRAVGDTVAACTALDAAGVPTIVAKGPVLAEVIYPRPDLRAYNDVDLFVPGRRFPDAVAALERAGCVLLDRNWRLIRREMRGQLHASAPHGTPLDVHWHLLNHRASREAVAIPMAELFDRRRMVSIGGPVVWTFEGTDTLLTLCIHAAVGGGARLSWLVDIDRAVRTMAPDWDEFTARARAWRCAALVGVVLRRAHRLLGTPVPADALEAPRGSRAWALALTAFERVWPPELAPERLSVTRVLTNATRDQTLPSVLALAAKASPGEKGSVLDAAGDDQDRVAYLAAVAA